MTDDDKIAIIERHIRDVLIPLGLPIKDDGVGELARRVYYSPHYSFSLTTGEFIPTFATAECYEQAGRPASAHVFKQAKDDTAPVAEKPVGEARFGGMTRQEFEKLPAAKRLEIYTAFETRLSLEKAAQERAQVNEAVKAGLPENFNEFSAETRHSLAAQTEAKIVAARKRSQS